VDKHHPTTTVTSQLIVSWEHPKAENLTTGPAGRVKQTTAGTDLKPLHGHAESSKPDQGLDVSPFLVLLPAFSSAEYPGLNFQHGILQIPDSLLQLSSIRIQRFRKTHVNYAFLQPLLMHWTLSQSTHWSGLRSMTRGKTPGYLENITHQGEALSSPLLAYLDYRDLEIWNRPALGSNVSGRSLGPFLCQILCQ
jgi:hypothetical protein